MSLQELEADRMGLMTGTLPARETAYLWMERYRKLLVRTESLETSNAALMAHRATIEGVVRRAERAEEALWVAADHAHEEKDTPWGYDAAGIHGYEPGEPSGCALCQALDDALPPVRKNS